MNNQNQKGIASLLAIIIVIVVGVLAIGGVLAYQYWWQAPKEETPEETPKDETAGWKIYRNEEYGFEIKYPPTFDSTELTLTFKKHSKPQGTDLLIDGKVSVSDGVIIPLSLSFMVFPTRINDLEKYVKDKVAGFIAFHEGWNEEHPVDSIKFNFTYSKITMGNAIGYAMKFEFPDSGQDDTQIFTQNSKNLILILYDARNKEKVEIIQKMLSTFRFID